MLMDCNTGIDFSGYVLFFIPGDMFSYEKFVSTRFVTGSALYKYGST